MLLPDIPPLLTFTWAWSKRKMNFTEKVISFKRWLAQDTPGPSRLAAGMLGLPVFFFDALISVWGFCVPLGHVYKIKSNKEIEHPHHSELLGIYEELPVWPRRGSLQCGCHCGLDQAHLWKRSVPWWDLCQAASAPFQFLGSLVCMLQVSVDQ